MPIVPTIKGRQIESRGVQTGGFQTFQQPNMGDALVQAGGLAVEVFAQEKQRANIALGQEASLQLNQFSSDLMTNPQTGLLRQLGKNAVGKGHEYTQQFDAKTQELASKLSESARAAFMQQAEQQRIQFATQAERYEIGQIHAYEQDQFQSTLNTGSRTASEMYADGRSYNRANLQIFQQIENYGFAYGWSDEQIQAKKIEFKEATAKAAAQNAIGANYKAVYQRNSELGDAVSGSSRVSITGGNSGDGARGIRNNNPGNIEYSKTNPWVGQTGDDGRFAKFETPEHGIRALGRNILSYQRRGVDTVSEIISNWAPEKDGNNTAAYIKAVCERLGVSADQPLDASNPDTLRALCAAIIHHENGNQPYSEQQLSDGVSAALGLSNIPTSTKRYTGTAWFDALNEADQASVLRQTEALDKQQREEYKTAVDGKVRDASAAYMRGVEFPNPPSENDFFAAYGVREGALKYTEFRNTQIAGQYIGSFRNMPTSSIIAYRDQLKPDTGATGEGYANRAELFDKVSLAANTVLKQRQDDPYGAAVELGVYKQITSFTPQAVTDEVTRRYSAQENLTKLGITAPILSSEESASLAQQVRGTQNVEQTISLLQSMGRTLPPAAMRQVASAIAPNNAATAYSALLLGTPDNQYDNNKSTIAYSQFIGYKPTMNKYDVAKTILAGDQLLNPTKAMKDAGIQPVQIPSEDKLKFAFDNEVGESFSSNAQARQMSYSLFKAAYAGIAYQSGDSAMARTAAPNSNVVEKAIQMATGGIYKGFNGNDVVMPFGMDKSTFKDRFTSAGRESMTQAGLNPASLENFKPVNIGNNRYRLINGSGRKATDPKTGQDIIVRVEQ